MCVWCTAELSYCHAHCPLCFSLHLLVEPLVMSCSGPPSATRVDCRAPIYCLGIARGVTRREEVATDFGHVHRYI